MDKELLDLWSKDRNAFYEKLKAIDKPTEESSIKAILKMKETIESRKELTFHSKTDDPTLQKINSQKPKDKSLVLLFMYYLHWFNLSCNFNRVEESKIILIEMEAIFKDTKYKIIQAEILICKAQLASTVMGSSLYLNALKLFPKNSQRRLHAIMTFVNEHSRSGTLSDVSKEYIDCLPSELKSIFFFINAVENGQIKEALKLKNAAVNKIERIPNDAKKRLSNSHDLLKLYLNDYENIKFDEWLAPVKALIERDEIKIAETARHFYENCFNSISTKTNFDKFTMLRSILSLKEVERAEEIIDEWNKYGKKPIYLDFFLARVELLKGNEKKAIQYFARMLKTCKDYNSMGRLDFELNLAVELKPNQIRLLTQEALALSPVEFEVIKDENKRTTNNQININTIIGKSKTVDLIKSDISTYAKLDLPVLILGESGVGKDITANALHVKSNRSDQPFIPINCSSIADSLLQSELFGHVAGAFTGASKGRKGIFQEAGNGTVFLDEIGDISPALQKALLRVFESNECRPVGSSKPINIHCRIIAATNADLSKKVKDGSFRTDLYFRLKRFVINIPPLRERPTDIEILSNHFINLNGKLGTTKTFDHRLIQAFNEYAWPGNIRELKNELEKMRLIYPNINHYSLNEAPFLNKLKDNHHEIDESSELESIRTVPSNQNSSILTKNEKLATPLKNTTDKEIENIFNSSGFAFRRIETIKDLFVEHHVLARKEIFRVTGIPNISVGRILKDLIKDGFIKKIEPTKSPRTHYFKLND